MSSPKFIHKSADYSNLHPWLGTGLLTSTGSKWQHRRKIITPTFHFSILDRFMESFNRNSRILVECLEKESGKPAFDVHHYISLCTLDIICESAMGTKVNAQVESESTYVKAVSNMCWLLYYRGIRPWLRIPGVFGMTANGKQFKKNLQELHAMSKGVIRKRKQEYLEELSTTKKKGSKSLEEVSEGKAESKPANGNGTVIRKVNGGKARNGKHVNGKGVSDGNGSLEISCSNGGDREEDVAVKSGDDLAARLDAATGLNGSNRLGATGKLPDEDDVYGSKKRSAFLDHLLELSMQGERLSDDDIREEVDTIMFEGHDTTGAALSFALYSLATNQHVQDKVYEEVYSIFGDSDRDATYQDLADMKYMEMFIKETLRLYPSVPLFWRGLREEVTLGSGYTLPAGSTVALNVFMLGRNPDAFPDPEQFDPDRFLPENSVGRHPFDYTPFSAGPRNCVGQKFAMLEMKVALAKVVRHYRLLPPPQSFHLDLAVEVVLKSRNGVMVRLEHRRPRDTTTLNATAALK